MFCEYLIKIYNNLYNWNKIWDFYVLLCNKYILRNI